jgi:hypothetical protein
VEGETFGARGAVNDNGVFGSSGELLVEPDDIDAERRRPIKMGSVCLKALGLESLGDEFMLVWRDWWYCEGKNERGKVLQMPVRRPTYSA